MSELIDNELFTELKREDIRNTIQNLVIDESEDECLDPIFDTPSHGYDYNSNYLD